MTKESKRKISKITPIICLIIFLILGFQRGAWHPAWMVFLVIPIVSSLLYTKALNSLFALVIIITYVIIGFQTGYWHPTWIMFLLIPIFDILFPKNKSL